MVHSRRDIAAAKLLAASSPATEAVFNVGTGVGRRHQLAETLLSVMNSSVKPEHAPRAR